MINNITFENFRGLKKLELLDLSLITLISGKNNAGKSSILEGAFLFLDYSAPNSFVKINQFRGLPLMPVPSSLWEPSFYNLDTNGPIRISTMLNDTHFTLEYSKDVSFVPLNDSNLPQDLFNQFIEPTKPSYALKYRFLKESQVVEEGHFIANSSGILKNINSSNRNSDNPMNISLPFVQYINFSAIQNNSIILDWIGKLELNDEKQKIINILKLIDNDISDISTIALNGQIQLYAKTNGKLLPLKLAGDGINKLLFLVLAILENPNSIILVDEIETGFHYSMYKKLWELIAVFAKENNCQIIATTHSYECIDGAVDGLEKANMLKDFCYYRVDKKGDYNHAYRYSGDLLRSAISTNMEVR